MPRVPAGSPRCVDEKSVRRRGLTPSSNIFLPVGLPRGLGISCLLLALVLAACPDGGGGPGTTSAKKKTVLNEGEGTPNQEPLWVLRPGQRIGDGVYVLDPVELEGETVIPLATSVRGPSEALGVPNEPALWMYLSQDADGNVYYRGAPREGLTPPHLLIPAVVRIGMKWSTAGFPAYHETFRGQSEGSAEVCANPGYQAARAAARPYEGHLCDGGHFTVEVTARRVEDTPYGVRPVWTFAITDWRRFTFVGHREWPDDDIVDGVSFVFEVIEGRGPTGFPLSIYLADGAPDLLSGVTPLDDAPLDAIPPPSPLPRLTLEPLDGGGAPLPDTQYTVLGGAAGGYLDPAAFDAPVLALHASSMTFSQIGNEQITIDSWATRGADLCQLPPGAEAEDCHGGAGVVIPADGGARHAVELTPGGDLKPGVRPAMVGLFERHGGGVHGVMAGGDGTWRCLRFNSLGDCTLSTSTGWPRPLTWETGPVTEDDAFVDPHQDRGFTRWPRSRAERRLPGGAPLWLDDHAGVVRIVERGAQLVFASWYGDEGRTRHEHVAYHGVAAFNAFARPGGQDVVLSTFAGRLERLHLEDDGVRLEPLGDVDVPDGQLVVGAVIVGDALEVYTQRGFKGVDPWFDRGWYGCTLCRGVNRAQPPDLGEILRWRAPLPSATPTRPAPLWGVTATASGHDVRVCWPPGQVEPSLDGWTLGGHAPRAVTPVGGEGRCVLLSRDLAIADNLAANSAWTVEGPIPGAGRVAIATPVQLAFDDVEEDLSFSRHAVPYASDGLGAYFAGVTAADGARLGAGGVSDADGGAWPTLDATFYEALAHEGFHKLQPDWVTTLPDAAGRGLYVHDQQTLYRWDGAALIALTELVDALPTFDTRCEGGGIIVNDAVYVSPDGDETPVPPGVDALRSRFRLADGSLCGQRDVSTGTPSIRVMACVDASGTLVDGPELPGEVQELVFGRDGLVYLLGVTPDDPGFGRLLAFDPTAMTLAEVDLEGLGLTLEPGDGLGLGAPTVAPDGTPFAVLTAHHLAYGEHLILRFGADGLTPIVRPELRYLANLGPPRLAVDDHFFVLSGGRSDEVGRPGADDADAAWFTHPSWLRLAREGDHSRPWSDFPAGSSDCVPMKAIDADQLSDVERSVLETWGGVPAEAPLYLGERSLGEAERHQRATFCSNATFHVESGEAPAAVVEVLDAAGEEQQVVLVDDDLVVDGARGYWLPELAPFERYTLRVGGGASRVEEVHFVTNNTGQSLYLGTFRVDGAVPGRVLGANPFHTTGCGLSNPKVDRLACGFSGRLDPNHRNLLLELDGEAQLVWADPGEVGGVAAEPLPTGGVFSPDGRLVIGPSGAYDVILGAGVTLAADRDPERAPIFALPEHPRVFLARNDGSGVVVAWDRDSGALAELVTTRGALDASFSGDGQRVVTLEAGDQADTWEVARYALDDGARTLLWTGPYAIFHLRSNADGSVVYADNGAAPPTASGAQGTRRLYAIREGRNARWFGADVFERPGHPPALAVDRRGHGALWFAEKADGSFQAYRYDETAPAPAEGQLATVFVPVAGLRFGTFDGTRVVAVGDGALVMAFDTNSDPVTRVLAAGDGAELMSLSGGWEGFVRSDGRLPLTRSDCGVDPAACRVMKILSTDQGAVDEEIDDSAHPNAPWPYGIDRERHDSLADVALGFDADVYWRHWDPSGLDMPCFLYQTELIDNRAWFAGAGPQLPTTSVLMCY